MRNSPRGAIDLGIAKDSEAMHRFLTGQLSYINEDFSGALKNLGRASELISEPQPELHFRLAELYLKSAEIEKALSETTRALEGDPDNFRYLLLQAGLLEASGQETEALPIYEKLIALKKDAFEGYLGLVSLYLRDDQEDKALAIAEQFVKAAPADSVGAIMLSRIREERDDLSEAAAELQRFHATAPDNIEVAVHMVRIFLKQGKEEQAVTLVSELLQKSPDNPGLKRLHEELKKGPKAQEDVLAELRIAQPLSDESGADARFRLATLEIQHQNAIDALLNLSIVLAEEPGREEARYYLASIYAAAGRRKEAIEELMKIEAGGELFIKARSFAALLLREDGNLRKAEEAMFSALKEEPGNRRLLAYLVELLREEKKFEQAITLMRKAIDEDPADDRLLFQYAVLLHDSGHEDDAIKVMRQVIEINPENSDALNYISYTLAEAGKDLDQAMELVQKALLIKPGDGFYLDTLGWIYFQSGNYALAEPLLSQAVNLTDQDVVIMEHYADCLVRLARIRQGRELYRRALEKAQASRSEEDKLAGARIEKKLRELPPAAGAVKAGGK